MHCSYLMLRYVQFFVHRLQFPEKRSNKLIHSAKSAEFPLQFWTNSYNNYYITYKTHQIMRFLTSWFWQVRKVAFLLFICFRFISVVNCCFNHLELPQCFLPWDTCVLLYLLFFWKYGYKVECAGQYQSSRNVSFNK